jgi:tetratricopeptide (TPR) repeat protein
MLVPPSEQIKEDVLDLFEELDSCTARSGPNHPLTLAVASKLATALRRAGDLDQAAGLLEQVLESMASSGDDLASIDLLGTLGEIMMERGRWDEAAKVYRERLDVSIRCSGEFNAGSIAAKADLACALFELGADAQANALEEQALDAARLHLRSAHSVSCVLAWNRALRYESYGEHELARNLLISDLTWLLAVDGSFLTSDQLSIRAMLVDK